MKPIARQLIVGVFVLALVTAVSFGIRHVRFSIHRGRIANATIAQTGDSHDSAETQVIAGRPDPKPVIVAASYKAAPSDDYARALTGSDKGGKTISEEESLKGVKDKTKVSKGGLEKISLGENEDLYVTQEGRLVYVGRGADGQTVKMQVQIDEATGEMSIVSKTDSAKSTGSKEMQKISMGGDDVVYINAEGQAWYVSDGSKARIEIDDTSGEMTVIERYDTNGGK